MFFGDAPLDRKMMAVGMMTMVMTMTIIIMIMAMTGDSERLSLTDNCILLCFVVLVDIPQVAAKIQKRPLQCN